VNRIPALIKTNHYRYFICFLIFLSYILVFFHRLCPAVIALEIQESFGLSGPLLGLLGSAYFYPYAAMQLPVGLLADSWGARKTISTFFLLAAAGSVVMGMAPGVGTAIFGRVLVGVGVSTVFVCNFKILSEWFTVREFAIMGGLFTMMGGLGALSASAPLAWMSELIGWRNTLIAIGFMTFAISLLVVAFVRDRPSDMGLTPVRSPEAGVPDSKIGIGEGIKIVALSRRFWPVSIWAFFCIGTTFAMGGLWGGPYLMEVYRMSKPQAGGVLSMIALGIISGGPLHGWLANRWGRKTVLSGCSAALGLTFAIFYVFTDSLSIPLLYLLFFTFSLAGAAPGHVAAAMSKELFPLSIAGTSVGLVNIFPFLGGALFQVAAGAVVGRGAGTVGVYSVSGFRNMFLLFLVGSLVSLTAAFLLRETLVMPEKASFAK
jgi:sugar phosphate permease